MQRLRIALPLLVVVLAVSLAGCASLSADEPPSLTVENRDDAEYRLTAYAVPNVDDPTNVTFRATTESGDRRDVDAADLRGHAPYRNVTLAEDGAQSQQYIAPPNESLSTTVDVWSQDTTVVYVVETTDGNESSAGARVSICEGSGQKHQLTISDGSITKWSVTCG